MRTCVEDLAEALWCFGEKRDTKNLVNISSKFSYARTAGRLCYDILTIRDEQIFCLNDFLLDSEGYPVGKDVLDDYLLFVNITKHNPTNYTFEGDNYFFRFWFEDKNGNYIMGDLI